jgi:hypothetical protein
MNLDALKWKQNRNKLFKVPPLEGRRVDSVDGFSGSDALRKGLGRVPVGASPLGRPDESSFESRRIAFVGSWKSLDGSLPSLVGLLRLGGDWEAVGRPSGLVGLRTDVKW